MARSTSTSSTTHLAKTYLSAATIVVLLGAIGAGLTFGLRPLEDRAAKTLDPGSLKVRIVWPAARGGSGTWLPSPTQEVLMMLANEAAGPSLDHLSADQLARICAAMEESGWFTGTPRITREAGGVITIDGAWRIPAANVVHRNKKFLISWDGKPMPPGVETVWTIYEPAHGPPRSSSGERDYAQPWSGEDVAASLELLSRIVAEPWSGQVKGIDASKYAESGDGLVIVTDKDTRIVWGGRPAKPRLGEIPTAHKIAHLRQLVKDTRRIDANHPLIYVNQERMQFDISASARQTALAGPE
ncbi:MAG: hypothetical protein JNK25_09505 [Phycisphaerae bacterium]|nr:hypothetical protein [Phycisphaerae bacterium]